MHLTRTFLEKRRLAAMETNQEEPPTFMETLPPVSFRGSTLACIERKSWTTLWSATCESTGAVHWVVMVDKTPASMAIFGRCRMWSYNNLVDAQKKFHQTIGGYV
jgi:hypothetical protein